MRIYAILAITLLAAFMVGCSSEGSGMSPDQEKMAQNVEDWAKASGGDWNKLTPEQQQTMIKSAGSEGTAKMVLQMKAHPPAPVAPGRPTNPGGPPTGG